MSSLIAFIAQWLLIVPAALVAASILLRKRWKADLVEAALSGIATTALVKIAGAAFFEQRPFIVEHLRPLVAHGADNAFPSDHLAACGLAFAYLWPRSRPLALTTLVLAALIAAARVLAHLHWPADVAAGFALGGLATIAVRALLSFKSRRAAHSL